MNKQYNENLMKKLINYTKHNKNLKTAVRKLNFTLLQRIKTFRHSNIHHNYKFILKDINMTMTQNASNKRTLELNLKNNNLYLKKFRFLIEDWLKYIKSDDTHLFLYLV